MKNEFPSNKSRKQQIEAIQKQRAELGITQCIRKKNLDLKAIEQYIINERPTNFDIMQKFNIAYNTFYGWLGNTSKEWKEFKKVIFGTRETLKEQTINRLESNLLKRAEGLEVKETITEITLDKDGNERKTIKEITKQLPPDVKAIETYLKHNSDKYKPDKLVDNNIIIGDSKTNIDNDKQVIINIKTTEDTSDDIEC